MPLPTPELVHVFDLAVTISPPVDIGETPQGLRRMIPITGGVLTLSDALAKQFGLAVAVAGQAPPAHGRVVPGGADHQLIHADGTQANLDARYVIEMHDGSKIFVANTALRVASLEDSMRLRQGQPVDPGRVYFRCQPFLSAAAPVWDWVNHFQFIGSGTRAPDGVFLSFYQVQ
jgi:Protein of unknown function (DUF3237)